MRTKHVWVVAGAVSAVLWMAAAADAAYVLLLNNTRIEGTDIRAKSDGEVILTTPQGQRSFPKGQYLRAVADKPADFEKAKQLIAAKSYDEAIRILNDIAVKYRYLEWDNTARGLLAQANMAKGDAAAAAAEYEQILRNSPEAKSDTILQWSYRESLLVAKQFDKLQPILTDLIEKGERADAARAQIMRGDIRQAQGQIEGAVMDYLRTVVLYEGERDAQPEALFKAAEGLDKLRDPRSRELYEKLASEYPSSPYAAKAAGK
ncbi:MAG: tetratricopeptide repeat protein [bacterium]